VAIQDERSTLLLNEALKQRGFNLDALAPKIDEQINAMARLGIEDDQVRAGLEIGSRFFKDQETLLKANAVAADISAATGKDLAEVMMILGKASVGQGKGLKELGIATDKVTKKTIYKQRKDEFGRTVTYKVTKAIKAQASFQDILTAATDKYSGIADKLANSTSGKALAAQIQFNEAVEKLGYQFLPAVNEGLTWVTNTGIPAFASAVDTLGPAFGKIKSESLDPFLESVGKLISLVGDNKEGLGAVFALALKPITMILDALKILIDGIVAGLQLIGVIPKGTGTSVNPMNDKYAGGLSGNVVLGTGGGTTLVTNVSIGTGKVDTVVTDSLKRTGNIKRGR
jgi:hypothetical protein